MIKYKKSYLLSDEILIQETDWEERHLLINTIKKLSKDMIENLRHLQPQIGCLNACKICSQLAGNNTVYWNERRQRNVIAALKYVSIYYGNSKPLVSQSRNNHRPGVIFSYLDNDIGNYYYLDKFVSILYSELGVKTRISTVGYSRHNEKLNEVHSNLNCKDNIDGLGGFRISFTPYAKGWNNSNVQKYSNEEYIKDISNILKIYKPYYNYAGAGSRDMCVELRYKPLAISSKVFTFNLNNHFVVSTATYMYISLDKNIILKEAKINNPYDHTINLDKEPIIMAEFNLLLEEEDIDTLKLRAIYFIENLEIQTYKTAHLYMLKNKEGIYYSLNPSIDSDGNFGINIYPKNKLRSKEGYLITERFLLNALSKYKSKLGMDLIDTFDNATWEDVENIVYELGSMKQDYKHLNKFEKVKYIEEEILPMIKSYILMLKYADYKPSDFFNPNFTIDTGIICNLGRAYDEFKIITSMKNEPLTPTHERNYGSYSSTMTSEGVTWRISCDYSDNIVIQKRDLAKTSGNESETILNEKIQLVSMDEKLNYQDLMTNYLIPGQKKEDDKYGYILL